MDGTNNCPNGTLKLITRQGTLDKQKAIVVSAGSKLSSQNRKYNSDKTNITNYFEDENATPLDNIYSSISNTPSAFNDFGLSIP